MDYKRKITVRHTSTIIEDYNPGDCNALENKLSVWDNVYYRSIPYFTYEEEEKRLRIPRGIDINFLERSFQARAMLDYEHDEFDKVSFKLKTPPRDDIQRRSICFLLGEQEFKNTKNHSQLSLNLTTGDGKTYCCIAAMTMLGMKSMIITHQDRIKMQWYESLQKFTTLDDTMICNLDSSKKIERLLDGRDKGKYKVFLVNHGTIRSYAKNNGWEAITELFKALKIGLKIYDEAHLEFANILKIDQYTNTKKNFYLTANFHKSSSTEDFVFNNAFSNVIKFGSETLVEKHRHIVYMPYIYTSCPSTADTIKIKNKKGFDRNVYCDYQLSKPNQFVICNDLVKRFISKNDTKVMVLFSKIVAVDAYLEELKRILPNERIGAIHSKLSDDERADVDNCRIIVSTPKSVGTGTDIANLGCVIMTEPYSSTITANQVSGRLRYLGNEQESFYIELVDRGFSTVYKMYLNRLKFFKKKCSKVIIMREHPNDAIE